MRVKRTERGWSAHFICASRCRFRRNTLLELGDRRIVVSTVGNMEPFRETDNRQMEEIGLERCWETMVFDAVYEAPYWEANTSSELGFDSPWALDVTANDLDANAMHERVVREIANRMRKGGI